MAQFRGTIQGQRGAASRLGNKRSGLTATAQGWNIGGSVHMMHDEKIGDVVRFEVNFGSNAKGSPFTVAYFTADSAGNLCMIKRNECAWFPESQEEMDNDEQA